MEGLRRRWVRQHQGALGVAGGIPRLSDYLSPVAFQRLSRFG